MRELTEKERKIIKNHEKWLNNEEGGERADLSNTDMSNTNLSNTNLFYADMSNTNLSYANLSNSDLSYANLSNSDLSHADLRNANLSGANLDYSCWPLWCGSLNAKADEALCSQLAYHLARLMQNSGVSLDISISELANKARQIKDHGLLLIGATDATDE